MALNVACSISARADTPVVAAAADLTFVLEEIAQKFSQETGHRVRLVFGASGNLYRQIGQGAPYQLFLSADEDFVLKLSDAGKTDGRGELYAIGHLALVVPRNSPLKLDGSFQSVIQSLAGTQVRKLAIANPEHAPYGRRAEETLRNAGLWDAVRGKLVLGENVAQAAQFVVSGNAQAGLVSYSLALSPALSPNIRHVLVPNSLHAPLKQRMVLLKGAGPTARAFYQYMQQPQARAIMKQYGFGLNHE